MPLSFSKSPQGPFSNQSRRVLAQKSYTPIITRLSMGKRPFSRKNCNFFCSLAAFSENAASRTQKSPRNGGRKPAPGSRFSRPGTGFLCKRFGIGRKGEIKENFSFMRPLPGQRMPGRDRTPRTQRSRADRACCGKARYRPPRTTPECEPGPFAVSAGQHQQRTQDQAQNDTQHREDALSVLCDFL